MDYFFPKTEKELTQRQLEEYELYTKIIQEGRRNPVWYAEEMFQIKLMDYQKEAIMMSWAARYIVWLMCRGAGKSSAGAIYDALRLDLVPNYKIFVSCNSASQSADYFRGLEDIFKGRNPTFRSVSQFFCDEIIKYPSCPTGFSHDITMGHNFSLGNGSSLRTLSTNLEAIRGQRGAIKADESLGMTRERAKVVDFFATTDSDFYLSMNKIQYKEPPAFPLQLMYTSSAGNVDTDLWDKYTLYSKQMILGNRNYYVCDFNIDTVLYHSTVDGMPIKSHISKDLVAKSLKEDPDKAQQELYNKFIRGGGKNAIVTPDMMFSCSEVYPPILKGNGKDKFIFCYDPARTYDNSILSIWKIEDSSKSGTVLRLANVISMVDSQSANKTPLPMISQVEKIRELLLLYNGDMAIPYENIVAFYIDAGAGGGGLSAIADNLMCDWKDYAGNIHRGIIDPSHPQYAVARTKYIDAIPIVKLVEPRSHKRIIYDALQKMVGEKLMIFSSYDNKEYLMLSEGESEDMKQYDLTFEEQISLTQAELMKKEILYMERTETGSGSVSFDLVADKRNKMHDDRAYTAALAAWGLSCMRRSNIVQVEDESAFQFYSCVTALDF